MCGLCPAKAIQREVRATSSAKDHHTLGMVETGEWCNSFVLVPNGEVRLCPDPAILNQALIRPVHRGPTFNDIFPILNNAKYLSLIDVNSGYHNLKLVERSSYLKTVTCQFGVYRYKRLQFGAAPTGDMFQREIHKIFKDLQNAFCTADDI